MSIIKRIQDYYKNDESLLFTTPSHSQGAFIPEDSKNLLGEKFFKSDFSEIEGFDNLRKPTGIIKDLQKKISKIYQSKQSFLLTNGSTSGVIAAMLAVLKPKDKVLVARNCHVSVYNGLVLTGAEPIWFLPEYDKNWGIYKGVKEEDIKDLISQNKDIKAVILTSPTYEGLYSDIQNISKLVKKHNIKLIVDEAHGALTNFAEFKTKPAILYGADISVQSLHKTAGAPNPCAIMHLSKRTDIPKEKIQNALNLINTTSPSYPLMAAIEGTINYLSSDAGKNEINTLITEINSLKKHCNENIEIYDGFNDPTKILLKFKDTNCEKIAEILNHNYKIEEEFSTCSYLLFITGIGTTKDKLNKLFETINQIKYRKTKQKIEKFEYKLPQRILTPQEAFFKESKKTHKNKAINEVSAELVTKYPPGIPIIIPGEKIELTHLTLIKSSIKTIC